MITEDSEQKKQAHETGGMSGKKAAVLTLGCKVNDVESGSLIAGLKTLGYDVTNEHAYADLYIINTCAVTAEAERKSRQAATTAAQITLEAPSRHRQMRIRWAGSLTETAGITVTRTELI